MAELPNDIIFSKIFPRLPVKTLLNLGSISTEWSTLITHPKFVTMHLNHITKSSNPPKLLLRTSSTGFHSLDYEQSSCESCDNFSAEKVEFPLKAHHSVELLGSCNGLACVALPHEKNGGDSDIVLWNPSTGDHKILPHSDLPISTFHVLGFGYDSASDDYMMVRVVPNSAYRIDLFSLKSNSWKTIHSDASDDILSRFYTIFRGTCLNGSIYWLLHRSFLSGDCDVIVRFDLMNEKFTTMVLPSELNHRVCTSLKMVGNCVGISKVICDHGAQRRNIEIWIMNGNDKESWTKLTTIAAQHCGIPNFMEPLSFLKNGEVLMSRVGSVGNTKFAMYDPKRSDVLQNIPVHGIVRCFQEMTYIESLVSPNLNLC